MAMVTSASRNGSLAALVLAAGRSTRMGEHKLLLPLGGRSLVQYAVGAACASVLDPVIVVVGHDADAVARALPVDRYHLVRNPDYADGMSTSLRAGIAAVRAVAPSDLRGAFVLLADQPLVSATWLNRLAREADSFPDRIIAATYGGRRGHPIYFPAALLPDLERVRGDEGGRTVIERHADRVRALASERAEVALDVDDPRAYARLAADWVRLYRDDA
jgi:molybdenum cofactor cytidylyltransferase